MHNESVVEKVCNLIQVGKKVFLLYSKFAVDILQIVFLLKVFISCRKFSVDILQIQSVLKLIIPYWKFYIDIFIFFSY